MKKYLEGSLKQIITIVLTIIVTSTISVTASAIIIDSRTIAYNDEGNVSNVKEALDTLYDSVEVTTLIPVGGVLPYMGTTAPTNYLICDGTEYNIADYKKLADHIKNNFGSYNFFGGNGTTTFKVPDLRGEFLRGSGTNSHEGQGNGANVGVHQDGTEHLWLQSNATEIYYGNANPSDTKIDSGSPSKGKITYSYKYGVSSGSNFNQYFTSRPTNTSVNYIIKVK